jgi:hypothetical protein
MQIDRLRELPSIVSDAEHWKNLAVAPQMDRPNKDEQCQRNAMHQRF